jgi:hypothetical protein
LTDTPDFTQTPQFAAAVEAAAAAAVAKALEGMRAHGVMPDSTGGAQALLSQLALTLAEVNNQGQPNKVVVDPIVMRQRAEAHERMVKLLVEAHANAQAAAARGDTAEERRWKPRYRLLKESYLGDRVVNPFRVGRDKEAIPQEITWSRAPNLSMKPLNAIAKEVFAEFRASIGNVEKVADASSPLMSITAGGLIVHGIALGKRQVMMEDDPIDADEPSYSADLDVITNDDPRNRNRRVLGTLAEPAKLNASDMPEARV